MFVEEEIISLREARGSVIAKERSATAAQTGRWSVNNEPTILCPVIEELLEDRHATDTQRQALLEKQTLGEQVPPVSFS